MNTPVLESGGDVRYVLHQTEDVTARLCNEQAVARAERRAEGILERMGDAHCVLDREFRIVSVNATNERVLGRPRKAVLPRSQWEVFPGPWTRPSATAAKASHADSRSRGPSSTRTAP